MVAQAVSPALPILDDFCRGLLVIFGFGSAYGTIQYEQDALTTPEPAPMICVFAGLGLISLGAWKRRSEVSSSSVSPRAY